ncbi:MAG: class I SAM-dependent methyltransferase [Chitinophagaceae bacterium]
MDLANKELVNCPLCDKNDYTKKYRLNSWNIVQCVQCNFVYVNPRLQKPELLKLYTDNYFDNPEVGYFHYKENKELRKKNFQKWIDDSINFFLNQGENCNALDIGCAAGYCLEIFKTKGWKPCGIELNREYASHLKQSGYKIYDSPFSDIHFEEKYGIITLFDVVEHLTDLHEHFVKLHSILDNNGIIILITPDYNSLQRKLLGKKWFQFKPIEHINYFSLTTFKKLTDSTGFIIVNSKKAGQYSNTDFLINRLRKYKFGFFIPVFNFVVKLSRLKNKDLYIDTASLYVVLRKK